MTIEIHQISSTSHKNVHLNIPLLYLSMVVFNHICVTISVYSLKNKKIKGDKFFPDFTPFIINILTVISLPALYHLVFLTDVSHFQVHHQRKLQTICQNW